MQSKVLPNENARLAVLRSYDVLDTAPETGFDDLTKLAAGICQTPGAMVTLVDQDRLWYKARLGIEVSEMPRVGTCCAQVVAEPDEVLIIEDTARDPQFASQPFVTGEPGVRFYAGAPLLTADGYALGALCVIDFKPRQLGSEQINALRILARQTMAQLELRRDLNERHRRENTLQTALQRLRFHVENSPIAVVEWDKDLRVLNWSPAAEQVFGWRAEDVIGLRINEDFQFLYRDDAANIGENVAARLLDGTDQRNQYTNRNYTKDGKIVVCEWFNSALVNEHGELISVMSLALDVTEQKRMQAELEAAHNAAVESARLKSEFLANVSHEIRTPMNGVVGMTEMLLAAGLNEEQREFVETIRHSADSLLTVINDILDISKIEANKLSFETVDFDLREVVESTVEMLAERAQSKGVEFAALVYSNVPVSLRGDPGRLRQILTNLIGNAVKFTERGEIVVRVKLEADDADGATLRFAVTDTGIGIAEDAQKQLFQPFTQIDSSSTRRFGGTGLGLAISKQIVEMMNGEIGVDSTFGKGSTFWFTARFKKTSGALNRQLLATAKPTFVQPIKQSEPLASPLAGLRILVADAGGTNRRVIAAQTAAWGMRVDEAANGAETLRLLREAAGVGQPISIAIVDSNMPGYDGFALAREIKNDLAIRDVQIVLTASYGQRGDAALARDLGIAGYLTKPVRGTQLREALNTLVVNQAERADDRTSSETPLVTRHSLREAQLRNEPREAVAQAFAAPLLVVEDNQVNRRIVRLQLEQLGYQVEAVNSGEAALERLETKHFPIILMDCQMPGLDGYQTTGEIRRREGHGESSLAGERTIIIALTAHALEGEREKCLAAGMDDYLAKPVKTAELARILERWTTILRNAADTASTNGNAINSSVVTTQPVGRSRNSSSQDETELAFDPEPLHRLSGGTSGAQFVAEITNLYLVETAAKIEQMRQVIRNVAEPEQTTIIMRNAHAIRGNSLAVGALRAAKIAERLEQHSITVNAAEVTQLIERLHDELKRLHPLLQKFTETQFHTV